MFILKEEQKSTMCEAELINICFFFGDKSDTSMTQN